MRFIALICFSLTGCFSLIAQEADQTSPKAVVLAYQMALSRGDGSAAKNLCSTISDSQAEWIDSVAAMNLAFSKLQEAASTKFGDSGKKVFTSSAQLQTERLVQAEVQEVEGKTYVVYKATATLPSGTTLVEKTDGKWVVVIRDTSIDRKSMTARNLKLAKIHGDEADEVKSGKYATVGDAIAAIKVRIEAVTPASMATAPVDNSPSVTPLTLARKAYQTQLIQKDKEDEAPAVPPQDMFKLVKYKSPIGELDAYLSVSPNDNMKHPVMIWITGGFGNSIDDGAWKEHKAANDQSASAYRRAGMLMMYPSFRGGNKNPGSKEYFYGEVDDVLAAIEFAAKQDYVDPKRIYVGGHSTGGTLAMLVAESTYKVRAVISFGPASRGTDHGFTPPFKRTPKEIELRSPIKFLEDIKVPVFVFEGASQGNIISLREMERATKNPMIHFHAMQGFDHFTVLSPVNQLIAGKLAKDTDDKFTITFTREELDGLPR